MSAPGEPRAEGDAAADAEGNAEDRILILAPGGRDAPLARALLTEAALDGVVVADVAGLAAAIERGAGAVVLTEESVALADLRELKAWIDRQPSWSDLPFVVLTARGSTEKNASRLRLIATLGNVALVERPFQPLSFVAAVRAALRSRRRQYTSRAQLREIERGAAALAEADVRKNEFLAMLAHELRNPLAPIRNTLGALDREPLSAQGRSALAIGLRQLTHISRLVDDLLEISRVSRGKIVLRPEPVALSAVIDGVAKAIGSMLAERSQRLSIALPEPAPCLEADPLRLTQVIENLLTNASKYSDAGGAIRVEAIRLPQAVEIRVSDDGVGIEPAKLPQLFQLFSQIDATLDRSRGGLGIGLALVKQLVELHGGSVDAYSGGLGMGSTFTVRLPLRQAASAA